MFPVSRFIYIIATAFKASQTYAIIPKQRTAFSVTPRSIIFEGTSGRMAELVHHTRVHVLMVLTIWVLLQIGYWQGRQAAL